MANKKARVLQAFRYGEHSFECDQVIDAPAAMIDDMASGGNVDADKAAVAYCVDELDAKPVKISGQRKAKPTKQETD